MNLRSRRAHISHRPYPGKTLILVLGLFFFCPFCQAQQNSLPGAAWKPVLLGAEQGLSSSFCYAIAQDQKGFIWVGTHDGLNRYDGYTFKVYRHRPNDPYSLPGNTITAVQADSFHRVWVIADGMLAFFDTRTERFTTLRLPGLPSGLRQLFVTSDHQLLAAGITAVLIDLNSLKPIPLGLPASDQACRGNMHFGKTNRGRLFALQVCENFLRWYTFSNAQMQLQLQRSFRLIGYHETLPPVIAAITDRNNGLQIVFSGHRPNRLTATDSVIRLKPSSWTAGHILEESEGPVFFSTEAGLFVQQDPDFKTSTTGLNAVVSDDVIRYGFQDRTGMLWFAGSKGVFRMNPKQRHIRHFGGKNGTGAGLADGFVFGLLNMPDGRICVDYFNRKETTLINPFSGELQEFPLMKRSAEDWVTHILLQSGAELPGKQKIAQLAKRIRSRGISFETIRGILPQGQEEAWIIVFQKLVHTGSGQSLELRQIPLDVKIVSGVLWMAFPGQGLWSFNASTHELRPAFKDILASGDITSLLPGDSGMLWVGTKGAGLYQLDIARQKAKKYTDTAGLAHNTVYCMTRDKRGRIWIGTAHGLSCLRPQSGGFQNYFTGQGFSNTEYNRHSAITLSDGSIAVGGMHGVDLFHPDSLDRKEPETLVQLTDVRVQNQSRGLQRVYRLRHDEHFISIHFAAMDFRYPEGNKFAYQMASSDTGWIALGNLNQISFNYLQPGEHRVRIRGANSEGRWSQQEISLILDISPAWYQRWWFYAFALGAVSGLVFLFFNYRLRQKLEVYRIRQRIHRDLHDDVGATLSSVKAYSDILRDHPDHPVIPGLIAQNATEMIDRLEVISWAADPRHDQFSSLRNQMIRFAAPLCHEEGIAFNLILQDVSEDQSVPGEIRQNLLLVFKEAIHNMIKYAEAKRCEVSLRVIGKTFEMMICDDGLGWAGTIRGSGQGWKNMDTRARELGGQMRIESSPGKGTEIVFILAYPFRIPNSWGRNRH